MPVRFVLVYQDQRVPLRDGPNVVGRSMTCHVRFNAPTVSRQHLILHVRGDQVVAENLSTSTGTMLNGGRLTEATAIRPSDVLMLGPREVRIERASPEDNRLTPPPTPALGLLPEGDDDEITQTELESVLPPVVVAVDFHTCPSCRTAVPFGTPTCPSCGHVWGPREPSSVIGQVTSRNVQDDVMMPSQVLAIYSSEAMTIDVTLDTIRKDGAFVPTELLDAPGTECELTLLPEGQSPLLVKGVVMKGRSESSGGPAGVDVRFTGMTDGTRLWIDLWVRSKTR